MALAVVVNRLEDGDEWRADNATNDDELWGIYARKSVAGDEEVGSIPVQIADSLAHAQRLGARRVRAYIDHGFSASKRRVVRPRFQDLLADISAGVVTNVVGWRAERLARQPRDAQIFLDTLGAEEPKPWGVAYTVRDGVDTRTDQGQWFFRQLVEFGKWEAKAIAHRVASAHQATMQQGRFSGSPPAFGHRDGTQWREVEPDEAALIREGAARVIAGQGVRSILRDWHERGIRTRRGALWQHRAWIKMVTSPRMIGARVIGEAEYVGHDETGQPWIEPILDRETWEAVRRILLDPSRRKHEGGGTPKHLLTGLMRCGICNGELRAKGQNGRSHGPGYWSYGCVRDAYHPFACGRVWIKGAPTDGYIEQVTLAQLRDPAVRRALTLIVSGGADDADEQAAELRREFDKLNEEITRREVISLNGPRAVEQQLGVGVEALRRWRAQALERRDDLERRIGAVTRQRHVLRAVANPESFWDQAALPERRALVRALFSDITVDPAPRARRWSFRRIRFTTVAE